MRFAVARGLIDVNRLNRRDPVSRRYERERLRIAEREMTIQLFSVLHQRYAAAAGFTPAGDPKGEQAVGMFEESQSIYRTMGKLLAPHLDWEESDADTLGEKEVKQAMSAWEQMYGSMEDPDTRRRLKAYEDHFLKSRGVEVYGDEEEPVDDSSGGQWLQAKR